MEKTFRKNSRYFAMFLLVTIFLTSFSQTQAAASIIATVPIGNAPFSVDVNELTNRVFVTIANDNNVKVVDGLTNSIIATIPLGTRPQGVAVNSTTNRIYVTIDLHVNI